MRTINKIISILIIVMLLAGDCCAFGAGLISYAANNAATENIKFSANFIDENGNKVNTIDQSSRNTSLRLSVSIAVENEGYFNGAIELQDSNFKIKNTILSDAISSIEENKVNLKQINNGEAVNIELEIEVQEPESISVDMLTKTSTLKLTGTYMQSEAKELNVDLSTNVTLKIVADEEIKTELETSIITNKVMEVSGENKRVVQVLIKSRVSGNEYPVKQTTIQFSAPVLSDQKPESIEMFSLGTQATNGEGAGAVKYSDGETEENTEETSTTENQTVATEEEIDENDKLQIVLTNEPNENIITWNRNKYDSFVITFIYDETVDATKVEFEANSEISLYDPYNTVLTGRASYGIENQELNNIVMVEEDSHIDELYKGQLYANVSATDKKDIQFETTTTAYITNANTINSLIINEGADKFVTESEELEANVKYIATKINYVNLFTVLGTEGSLTIDDGVNTIVVDKTLITENKVTPTAEGDIYVYYPENTTSLNIMASAPVSAGVIELTQIKAIGSNDYTKEQLKAVTSMKNTVTVQGLKDNQPVVETSGDYEIKMNDTITKAELTIDKQYLSTMQDNNVIMGIKLVTENEQYDLYKNPVIRIQLPDAVESIKLNNADKLYAEGFTIKAQYDTKNKVIILTLTGEQTEYTSVSATQIYLQLDLTLTLSQTAPKATSKITMEYTNENATTYFGGTTDKGIVEQDIGISSPNGLFKIFNIEVDQNSGISVVPKETGSSSTGEEDENIIKLEQDANVYVPATATGIEIPLNLALVNNIGEKMTNVKILGILPTTGNTVDENENTFATKLTNVTAENATIYYTENPNATSDINDANNGWTTNINSLTNPSLFLVVLNELDVESNYIMRYTVQLPDVIDPNLISATICSITYDTETSNNNSTETRTFTLLTPTKIEMETTLSATVGNDTLKDGDTVKVGEVIKYKMAIKNIGERQIKNITLKGLVPEGTVLVEPEEDYELTDTTYYTELTDVKEKSVTITSLDANQTYEVEYEVRVKEATANTISNTATGECEGTTVQSTPIQNKIENSNIRVTVKSATINDKIANTNMTYYLFVENLSGEEVKNLKLSTVFEGVEIDTINHEGNLSSEISSEINIESIPANGVTYYTISGVIKEDANEINAYATIEDENGQKYRSNKVTFDVLKPDISITLSSPTENSYIKQEETVEYYITVENTGDVALENVTITDTLPQYLSVTEIYANNEKLDDTYLTSNTFSYFTDLQKGQSVEIRIVARAVNIAGMDFETIPFTNSATVSANEIPESKTTDEVTHILLPERLDPDDEQNPGGSAGENPGGETGENPGGSTGGNTGDDTTNPGTGNTETYIISGIAWIDEDMNGERDSNDPTLSGITVRLYDVSTNNYLKDSDGNIIEKTTDENGNYTFTEVPRGQYIVLFEYDMNQFELTTYEKPGVNESRNSNAVLKNINVNGEELLYAVTDTIDLQNNIANINIGLKRKVNFDLELNKYITRVTVQNSQGTKTTDYDNETFTKVEIAGKQLKGSLVILEYTIQVRNTGDVAGYVSSIIDYLPSGLTFSSELNSDWYILGDNLYTKKFENEIINPGETKEIKLILTKTMTENNVGLINNRAEIYEAYNEYGTLDIDSTSNNQINGEDDLGSADVYVGIKTGATVIAYIIIAIVNIVLIGIAIRLIISKKEISITNSKERR